MILKFTPKPKNTVVVEFAVYLPSAIPMSGSKQINQELTTPSGLLLAGSQSVL